MTYSLELAPGVNFTNVLQAAFALADPESVKKLLDLTVLFALLVSGCVKAAQRTLMKLTPGLDVIVHSTFFDLSICVERMEDAIGISIETRPENFRDGAKKVKKIASTKQSYYFLFFSSTLVSA